MKHMKQTLSCLLASILLLCCACSSTGANETISDAATTNMAVVSPMAQQGTAPGFTDVAPGAWYEEAANWCREQGILDGDTFSPDMEMTRATVAEALYRVEGSPVTAAANFPDVPAGSAYANAAAWASANGVMSGYTDGLFGADDPVTREQMAAILWRYAGEPAAETGQDFADKASIAGFARTAVDWASTNGVFTGKDANRFDPQGTLTRAETATILYRFLKDKTVVPSDGGGTAIILNMNGTDIHARLYENTAAGAFLKLLPYTVTVSRAAHDLCGTVSEQLSYDPAEDQDTWAIGEIGWFDGWFTILCDNEEGMPKRTRTIIGKIDDEDIPTMQALTGSVEIKVTLDESVPNAAAGAAGTPTVYFTSDISPEGLLAVYEALGWKPDGEVAVKLSTGEPPASNYLRPELIKDLVQSVNGTIVECNTAYGGSRASTAMHYQVAEDHGFTDIADFQILDEDGSMTLPVEGGSVLTENYVGKAFTNYDSYLILSHFKGHSMAGYGGAIKNISIGLGSSEGKNWIHSGGTSRRSSWGGQQDAFLEAMAEAGKSVADYLGSGKGIVYVNVMNRLSVDCDCDGHPAEPDMHDIGILASYDPVALDQACIDLVYSASDSASLIQRIESRNGIHTIEHAAEIGLGSREYTMVNID